jgi:outer membrane protein assembly factor BamB
MPQNRSKFKPHWSLQIILGLLFLVYLFLSFKDSINDDPALANVVKNVVLLNFLSIYFIWFMFRSSVAVKFRLGFLMMILGFGAFFYSQYNLVGWSGLLNPEFEKIGSRDHKNADPLMNFIYDQNGKAEGPGFTQFLGNGARDAHVKGPTLDLDWSKSPLKEVWRKKIGEGLSGFAVKGDYAITMEQRGGFELTVCYDLKTGHPRWADREEVRHESKLGGVGPRSTVLIDEYRVYSLGATGRLSCVQLKNGTVIWKKDILSLVGSDSESEKASIPWGRSGSVLLVEDKIIVSGGGKGEKRCSFLALNKVTGEVIYKVGDRQISYASPQLLTIEGVQQTISINESSVSGYAVMDGKMLWETDLPGRTHANANCSQVRLIGENQLFISKAYHEGARLVTLTKSDDEWKVKLEWHQKRIMRTKFSNTLKFDESKIIGLDERDLQAVDALSGKVLWEGERYGYGQILRYNQHVIVLGENGDLALVDPENGQELSRQKVLTGKTWCNVVIAGKYLLVRNNNEAVCYELPFVKSSN